MTCLLLFRHVPRLIRLSQMVSADSSYVHGYCLQELTITFLGVSRLGQDLFKIVQTPELARALSATLTIVRPAKAQSSGYLKRFEILFDDKLTWDIVPEKLRLRDALARLVFARQQTGEYFDALLEADGKILVDESSSTDVDVNVRLSLIKEQVVLDLTTGLAAGVKPSQVLDILSLAQVSRPSFDALAVPPGLPDPDDTANRSQVFIVFQRVDGQWRLNQARSAVYPKLTWNPFPSATVQDLHFVVAAFRPDIKPEDRDPLMRGIIVLPQGNQPTDLVYTAVVPGTIRLANTNLTILVDFDSTTNATQLRCFLPDGDSTSILGVLSDPTLHPRDFSQDQLEKLLDGHDFPSSSPVRLHDVGQPGLGIRRQVTVYIADSTVSRITVSAFFPDADKSWKLTDSLTLRDMGIWLEYTLSTRTLISYVFGSFNLSNGRRIYGFVPGTKNPSEDFTISFSGTINPTGGLGISPMEIFEDLGDLKPDTQGWDLPTNLPTDGWAVLQSPSSTVNLSFTQADRPGDFVLQHILTSLPVGGTWTAIPGLNLQDLSIQVVTLPKGDNRPHPSTTFEIKGTPDKDLSGTGSRPGIKVVFGRDGNSRITSDHPDEEGDGALSFSPSSLVSLTGFDSNSLGNLLDDLIPANFPVQPHEVVHSQQPGCVFEVTKKPGTGDLDFSKFEFTSSSDKPSSLAPGFSIIRTILRVLVTNPQGQKPNIATSANVVLDIGGAKAPAKVTFQKPTTGPAHQVFDLRVTITDLSRLLSTLAGKELDSLTPPGTPTTGNQKLPVQIVFAGDVIQTLTVRYPSQAVISFAPFKISQPVLTLTWAGFGEPTVAFTGQASCGDKPLDITLSNDHASPDCARFVVHPGKERPLYLSDVTAQGLPAPAYDVPEGCVPFDQATLSSISGVYGVVRQDATPTIGILQFEATVLTDQVLTVFDLEDRNVQLRDIGLRWTYSFDAAKTISKAIVFAKLRCHNTETNGADQSKGDIRVQLLKDSRGREVYTGTLKTDETNSIDFKEPLDLFLPSRAYTLPTNVNLPSAIPLLNVTVTIIRNTSIEINGNGTTKWEIPLDQTSIHFDRVGLHIRAQKNAVAASITGVLSLANFKSAEERAHFHISTATNSVLRANIERSAAPANGGSDLDQLTTDLALKPLRDVVPDVSSRISFDKKPLFLHADFNDATRLPLCVTGRVTGMGHLGFFTSKRPDTGAREYVVSMPSTTLASLFSWAEEDLASTFDVCQVDTFVVSYDGTIRDLVTDIDAATTLLPANVFAKIVPSYWDTMPVDTTLSPGAWFFTKPKFDGQGSLTNALVNVSQPGHLPSVTLFGKVSSTQNVYGVVVRDLRVLDNSLAIDVAVGSIVKDATTGSNLVALRGGLTINGLVDTNELPAFNVNIALSDTSAQFTVDDNQYPTITNPFGDMPNVSLAPRSLVGTIDYKVGAPRTNNFTLLADAFFGSEEGTTPEPARVVFMNGLPQVVVIDINEKPISGIFGKVIEGAWPSEFPDFNLTNGTIYYAKQDTADTSSTQLTTFYEGYHLTADILLFDSIFRIRADVLDSRDGVVLNGSALDVIDTGFIKLLKPTVYLNTSTSNITVSVSPFLFNFYECLLNETPSLQFTVSSDDVLFFGDKAPSLQLFYVPGDNGGHYRGTLQQPNVTKPFVTILYKNGHFGIDDWIVPALPTDQISQIVQLDTAIAQASEKSPSSQPALTGLSFDKPIVPQFTWKFTKPSGQEPVFTDGTLNGQLVWSYTITIPDSDDVLTFDLPDVPVSITSFTLSQITEVLITVVHQHTADIGKVILDRPDVFERILDAMSPDHLGPQIIKLLISRGIKSTALQHAFDFFKREHSLLQNLADNANTQLDKAVDEIDGTKTDADQAGEHFAQGLTLYHQALGPIGALVSALGADSSFEELGDLLKDALDKKKPVQQRIDEVHRSETRIEELRKQLKQKIESVLAIRGAPRFVLVAGDDGHEQFILDWSHVLPAPVQAQIQDVLSTLVWDISYQGIKGDEVSQITLSSVQTSWTVPTTTVVPGTTVKVLVRARFVYQDEEFTGPWSDASSVVYTKKLDAPKGVSIITGQTDRRTVAFTVRFPKAPAGTYEVAVTPADHQTHKLAVLHKKITTSTDDELIFPLDVWQFHPDAIKYGTLQVLVRRVTADKSKYRDSTWTLVPNSEFIVKTFEGTNSVVARRFGKAIIVEWEQPGPASDDFELVVLDAKKNPAAVSQQLMQSPDNRRVVRLTKLPAPSEEGTISLAIRAVPAEAPAMTYYLPARLLVKLTPETVFSITDESYYDIGTKSTVLYVTAPTQLTQVAQEVVVSFATPEGTQARQDVRAPLEPIDDHRARIVVPLALGPGFGNKAPGYITVKAVHSFAQVIGSPSDRWKFPDLNSSFSLVPFQVSTTVDGSIQLSWTPVPGTDRTYLFTLLDSKQEHKSSTLSASLATDTAVKFSADSIRALLTSDATHIIISVVVATASVRSQASLLYITLPNAQQDRQIVSIPSQQVSCLTWRVLPQSNIVALHRPTQRHMEFFTSIHDPEVEQTQIRGLLTDPPKTYPVTAAAEPPLANGSSAITVCSRADSEAPSAKSPFELFYIGDHGRIYGRPWDTQFEDNRLVWRTPIDYPFRDGMASTLNGGALSAVARSGSTELFWAGPDGKIWRAFWTEQDGWLPSDKVEQITTEGVVVSEAAVSADGGFPAEARPALEALQVTFRDDAPTVLFSVAVDGSVLSFVGPHYTPVPVEGAKASFTAGIATAATRDQDEDRVWVFWVNPVGAVQATYAVLSDEGELGQWTVVDVTTENGAHANSRVTVVQSSAASGAAGLMVMWATPESEMRAARVAVSASSEIMSWYSFVLGKQLKFGSAGPLQVAAAADVSGKRAIAWCSEDQRISELEFDFEGEWIQY